MENTIVIPQRWKPQVVGEGTPFPFLVVDNWYTEEEEKKVWKELDFYSSHDLDNTERAETSIVARHQDGTSKSKAFRYYFDLWYNDLGHNKSHINNFLYKFKTTGFHSLLEPCLPYSRSFPGTNRTSSMISYYEENDHYESHFDSFMWTTLIWYFKEPKQFEGGDFNFPDSAYTVKLKHNRMVMFPCSYLHQVTPVKFKTPPKESGLGRYTITHFHYTIPSGLDLVTNQGNPTNEIK